MATLSATSTFDWRPWQKKASGLLMSGTTSTLAISDVVAESGTISIFSEVAI